jgi:serine/threonine protein kinase/tetratricopeptide (TPR) repeat protein
MVCSRCGADVPPPLDSCPRCGARLAPDLDAPTRLQTRAATKQVTGDAPSPSSEQGPLKPGQIFSARYHIIRLLGIGGMGAVYQAWDVELGVTVAIKVIRPEVVADPTATAAIERGFKRELLLARQVTHKNVVRIHDLGAIDGIKYITMSYVDGADLATLLKREGRLPVRRALTIARQVVSGLVAAHQADIVHRDLKPANIMIDANGDALIMDFGIARSTGATEGAGRSSGNLPNAQHSATIYSGATTMDGTVVGTLGYMAPEQAKAQAIDQRADVYSFGLILYDMLVGRYRREHAKSALDEMEARMEQPPPPARSIVPEIPEALSHIVSRCLEPDPAKRWQTTAALAAELDRLDEHGVPIPIPPRYSTWQIAGIVTTVLALVTATWWFTRTPPPPKPHEPVTMVIADFHNSTGDPAFDHTLEPMLRRALESATFISAYDRSRFRANFGIQPPDKLDDQKAREIALKQGVGVVLSGSIDRQGSGYEIAVQAVRTVTGQAIASTRTQVSNKDQVPEAATRLVTTVRTALGDETSDSAQLLAMKSLSTTSMAVANHYAAAIEAQSNNKFEEARQSFLKAVELDPGFGLGYQGLALMSRNLGKPQDAEKYNAEALRHLERMTDRERFAVRASYYMNTGDSQQCVKEYGELIAQYAADAVAHNNRALCLSKLRNMRDAVAEMRQAVEILPKRVLFRGNLAVYAAYAGDVQTAEEEFNALQEPTDLATLALAFSQLGQGRVADATQTYQKLATIGARGASWAASGAGDLALYEGRFSDAARIFEQGASSDLAAKNADRAARKFVSLAYVRLLQAKKTAAAEAAEQALQNSKTAQIRFLAGRILVEADSTSQAATLAAGLSSELPAEPQAFGKIIEGELALKRGDARGAVKILTDANTVLDTWLGHFDLGRAYLALRAFPQADSEFDRCIKRRGEALSLLVDEEPTYGYFPPVYYYQGLVREGLKNAASADSYRAYLAIRGNSSEDPLLPDIRQRAGH